MVVGCLLFQCAAKPRIKMKFLKWQISNERISTIRTSETWKRLPYKVLGIGIPKKEKHGEKRKTKKKEEEGKAQVKGLR